jgi:mannose-6-phosphate isomerase-like protein (cupin superfamily)
LIFEPDEFLQHRYSLSGSELINPEVSQVEIAVRCAILVSLSGGRTMDRTPPPVSLAAALALPRTPGRSSEMFVDGDLEVRFAARPTNGPQVPHQRDELYFVASGSGHYRVEETVTAVGPGDVLFCAAHAAHGFEDISEDFSVWVLFYGQQK